MNDWLDRKYTATDIKQLLIDMRDILLDKFPKNARALYAKDVFTNIDYIFNRASEFITEHAKQRK